MSKLDEFFDNLSKYQNLNEINTQLRLQSPFYKKRRKYFTEKLLKEDIIDEEFLMMINTFTLEELIILKFEQIYEHYKINTFFNVKLFMSKIEHTILMVTKELFEETQVDRLFRSKAYKQLNERKFNKTKEKLSST
jgi:hypothetical protein